jgi:hypothetical protein
MKTNRLVRYIIDCLAMFFAVSITYEASGSWLASAIAGTCVGAYGFWCFYDGITVGWNA